MWLLGDPGYPRSCQAVEVHGSNWHDQGALLIGGVVIISSSTTCSSSSSGRSSSSSSISGNNGIM